ncbi:hypothetical protein Dimus_013116, partial [Dionaea muscipula]
STTKAASEDSEDTAAVKIYRRCRLLFRRASTTKAASEGSEDTTIKHTERLNDRIRLS